MDSIVFTPASLIDLLSQIEELSEYEIGIVTTESDQIQLTVGESVYDINTSNATEVSVEEDVVETVEDTNMSAYESLDDSVDVDVDIQDPVESGVLKELTKSLLLGGMIRLSGKLLK